MSLLWLLPLAVLMSLLMTGVLRRYALTRSLLDVPNARSSHALPTPRGGGVAIVLTVLGLLPGLAWAGLVEWRVFWGVMGAGLGTAVLGFIDDHQHVAARWRLLGHFLAAFWLLAWLGGVPPLALFGSTINMGMVGFPLAAVALVWLLNLYNFMDGIDGIASIEAITVCVGAAVLYVATGHGQAAVTPLLLAGAIAGFLFWNFPPARIFMGDAGSGFLGIMLGALVLHAAWLEAELLWSWLILLALFIVDATFTLMRRLVRGEKLYEAHRSHAYQYAARHFGCHLPVTLAVGAINIVWLLPMAFVVALGWLDGATGLVLACLPLLVLALKFHAGESESGR